MAAGQRPRIYAWGAGKGVRHGNSQVPRGTWGLGVRPVVKTTGFEFPYTPVFSMMAGVVEAGDQSGVSARVPWG